MINKLKETGDMIGYDKKVYTMDLGRIKEYHDTIETVEVKEVECQLWWDFNSNKQNGICL